MALQQKDTLATLRSNILARCGFGNQGAPTTLQKTVLNSMIQGAQEETYWDFRDFGEMKTKTDFTTVAGQLVYDWPDTVDPNHRVMLSVFYSNTWIPLKLGIDAVHDTYVENGASFPQRYDLGQQIEIWPQPEDAYTVRIEHFELPDRLTQDEDRTSLPDYLVFLKALYKAKLHYRQPDAAESEQAYVRILSRMRSGNHQNKRYIRGRMGDRQRYEIADIYPRPGRI